MTNSSDDPWADLYKDLGLPGEPSSRPRDIPAELPDDEIANHDVSLLEEAPELLPAASDDAEGDGPEDEADDAEAIGEEEGVAGATNEDGTRKRRRRRRRRKKKPGTAEAAAGEAAPAGTAIAEEEADEPAEFEPAEAEAAESEEDEFNPELTRDLIANWNVPSWREIVAGLYRPERG